MTGSGSGPARESVRPSSLRELPFPLSAPTWPASVPRPPKRSELGVNYDTDWARRYPVRLARAAWTDFVTRPLVSAVAQPSVEGLDRFEAVVGPVIFAANHSSHLDTPLVLSVLPEPLAAQDRDPGCSRLLLRLALEGRLFCLCAQCGPDRTHKGQP